MHAFAAESGCACNRPALTEWLVVFCCLLLIVLFQCLGYRTLASMCSLLLGFFATSSSDHRVRIMKALHLSSLSPLVRLIKEFLLLQSDAQLLQQAGLQSSFNMLTDLEKAERRATNVTSTSDGSGSVDTEGREAKRAKF